MAYDNPHEAGAPLPMVSFNGTTLTGHRAFEWHPGSGNERTPRLVPSGQIIAGITCADGKAGYLAVPGMLVKLEFTVPNLASISLDTFYQINNIGQGTTTTGGTLLKAREAYTNTSGATQAVVLWVEIWKPKG